MRIEPGRLKENVARAYALFGPMIDSGKRIQHQLSFPFIPLLINKTILLVSSHLSISHWLAICQGQGNVLQSLPKMVMTHSNELSVS